MQFSIRALMLLTAAVAVAIGIQVTFWKRSGANDALMLGWYLVAVALATAASFPPAFPMRNAFRASAIFGWAYLCVVLKVGFERELIKYAEMGLALMLACFVIAACGITLTTTLQRKKPTIGT